MLNKLISKQGYQILHYYKPESKLVYTNFVVRSGSFHEDDKTNGVAHFLEHMTFQGFQGKSKKQILFESGMLGYFNAYTSYFSTVYEFNCLNASFAEALKLMSGMVFESILPQEELEKERSVILEEWRTSDGDQNSNFYDEFCGRYFYDYKSVLGTESSIKNISRNDLINYKNKWYGKENMIIVVVGGITSEDLLRIIDENLPDRSCQLTPVYMNLWGSSHKPIEIKTNKFHQGVHSYIKPLSRGIELINDNLISFFLSAINYLLYKTIRDDFGLCYSIGANYFGHFKNQYFYTNSLVKKENVNLTGEKIQELFDEIIKNGFPKDAYEVCLKKTQYNFSSYLNMQHTIHGFITNNLEINQTIDVVCEVLNKKLSENYIESKAKQINADLLQQVAIENLQNFTEFVMVPDN